MQVTQDLEALERSKGSKTIESRMRRISPLLSTLPHSYLQVVTFLHIEVQSVLQLFQIPGFLQDTLPLAKSLQPTCFPAKQIGGKTYNLSLPTPTPRSLILGKDGLKKRVLSPALAGAKPLAPQPLRSPYPSWLYF